MRHARALALLALLLAASLAGCIGDEPRDAPEDRNVTENSGCSVTDSEGTVTPQAPLATEAAATGAPASASIGFDAEGYGGGIELVLEGNGTEVWSDELPGVGSTDYRNQVNGLEAGSYTLTARTDTGVAEGRIELAIAWGGGTCG